MRARNDNIRMINFPTLSSLLIDSGVDFYFLLIDSNVTFGNEFNILSLSDIWTDSMILLNYDIILY